LLAIRRRKGESFSRTLRYREVFLCARTWSMSGSLILSLNNPQKSTVSF
jgi:hypothetical protein